MNYNFKCDQFYYKNIDYINSYFERWYKQSFYLIDNFHSHKKVANILGGIKSTKKPLKEQQIMFAKALKTARKEIGYENQYRQTEIQEKSIHN